ncbi:hypothetical protein HJV72_12435, partial [Extibacter sp. GGCC_0201]|nr:hypothetical protein [Extibacter sp. GGCC_0201]
LPFLVGPLGLTDVDRLAAGLRIHEYLRQRVDGHEAALSVACKGFF